MKSRLTNVAEVEEEATSDFSFMASQNHSINHKRLVLHQKQRCFTIVYCIDFFAIPKW